MGGYDDGGGDRSTEDAEHSEYRSGSFDSIPHDGLSESRPEEKEEEHGTLVEYQD